MPLTAQAPPEHDENDGATCVIMSTMEDAEERIAAAFDLRDQFYVFVHMLRGSTGRTREAFYEKFVSGVRILTPAVMSNKYGRDDVRAWVSGDTRENTSCENGAIHHLVKMIYDDHFQFCVGSIGSVWFDAWLKGGDKTKRTRVSLHWGENQEDHFDMMLDATFDEEW